MPQSGAHPQGADGVANPAAHAAAPLVLAVGSEDLPREDRPPQPLLYDQWVEWTDYSVIRDALATSNISAPAELVPALEPIVADAASEGIDLKIVITLDRPAVYPMARDLATRISLEHEHSTIYVATPNYLGSYSDTISRARLESAQDDAYRQDDPIAAAAVFEARITEPTPPWALYSGIIIVLCVVAVAAFVLAHRRRLHTAAAKNR